MRQDEDEGLDGERDEDGAEMNEDEGEVDEDEVDGLGGPA